MTRPDSPAHPNAAPDVADTPDYLSRYGVEVRTLEEVLVKGMLRTGDGMASVACVLQVGQVFVPRAATSFGTILDVTAESRVEKAPGCPVGLRGVTTSPMISFSRSVPPNLADKALRHEAGEELWKRVRELSVVNPAFAPAGYERNAESRLDARATTLPDLPVEHLPGTR